MLMLLKRLIICIIFTSLTSLENDKWQSIWNSADRYIFFKFQNRMLFHVYTLIYSYFSGLFSYLNELLCCICLNSTSSTAAVWSPHPPRSVWHLLNLSGVYWCNNWCLHNPTHHSPAPTSSPVLPLAPTQWIHLHPDYRTNCHAERKANQILKQKLGEEIAFLSHRGASPVSPCLRFWWRERRDGWKVESSWTAALSQVKSHPFPPILGRSRSLLFFPPHFSPHSFLTLPISHPQYQGLHSCLQVSRWNGTIITG